jgi:serine/threonine protein kinase/Tfp pilus assembly protein PilF
MTVFQPIQFGKYQLLDKIAVGGMAELYRAKLTGAQGFEKLIAIKRILPNLCEEESLITSFIDEAKLAALLHHENIVQIYDFGNLDNEYFIAMEFLFGKDLRTIRKAANNRERPLGMGYSLYIISRICAGLDYSHNLKDLQGKPLNIIHRDINPQNILVTYEGQVKIIDYGIAKAASRNNKTRENLIKGKLAYMSPEQANGQTIDHRSDIFSTGIILYELLADRRMFEGETMHVLSLVREAQYDPPEEVIPDLPAELNQILHRALAKDPDERYQSASEMLADLEEFAFELSLRPNARSFAQYLKELFEEEFAEEELALWAKSKIYEAGENGKEDENSEVPGTYDSTVVLSQPFEYEKLTQLKQILFKGMWLKLAGVMRVKRKKSAEKGKPGKDLPKPGFKLAALKPGVVILVFLVVVALGIKQISFSRSDPDDRPLASQQPVAAEPVEYSKLSAGRAALEAKRYTLAVTLFEEIIASDPAMMRNISEYYVKASLGQAAELLETNPDQAKNILLKALKIDSDNISGLSDLGFIYMGQQNYPKAIETYLKVAGLAPHIPDTYFNLGYVFAVTKKYQQAKEMYRRVVELNPVFTDEALFNLAVINEQLGEHTKCMKNLEQAVAFNPGNESAKKYLHRLKKKTGEKKG